LNLEAKQTIRLKPYEFIVPGFIDTHVHAPQFEFTGKNLDFSDLFHWLQTYTFPTEESFENETIADRVYSEVVKRFLAHGTTTVNYFGTCHLEGTKRLAAICDRLGQRAVIGRVSMDQYTTEKMKRDVETDLFETNALLDFIAGTCSDRIMPSIIPRFSPTCSQDLLERLGDLSKRRNVRVHSHLSESKKEVEDARKLHPNFEDDTHIFRETGLLTPQSIYAHSIFLSDDNIQQFFTAKAAIAHCPLSNFYFANANFPLIKVLKAGVKVGLGTDIAGGYSFSMFDAMRHCVTMSKSEVNEARASESLSIDAAFCLSTLGGAQALNIDDRVGMLEVGMEFDALLLSANEGNTIHIQPKESENDVFQKLLYQGNEFNISSVWIQGNIVYEQRLNRTQIFAKL